MGRLSHVRASPVGASPVEASDVAPESYASPKRMYVMLLSVRQVVGFGDIPSMLRDPPIEKTAVQLARRVYHWQLRFSC